jgi:hypothetical protein
VAQSTENVPASTNNEVIYSVRENISKRWTVLSALPSARQVVYSPVSQPLACSKVRNLPPCRPQAAAPSTPLQPIERLHSPQSNGSKPCQDSTVIIEHLYVNIKAERELEALSVRTPVAPTSCLPSTEPPTCLKSHLKPSHGPKTAMTNTHPRPHKGRYHHGLEVLRLSHSGAVCKKCPHPDIVPKTKPKMLLLAPLDQGKRPYLSSTAPKPPDPDRRLQREYGKLRVHYTPRKMSGRRTRRPPV